MKFPVVFLSGWVCCCLAMGTGAQSAPLTAEQIVLVVNRNVADSRKLAEFYARTRSIPDNRIVSLDLPGTDEISFAGYEQNVVGPVRDFLRQNGLENTTRCLVTFYGVPLRIADRANSPEDVQELSEIKTRLADALRQLAACVVRAEELAGSTDRSFRPGVGASIQDLAHRADVALARVAKASMDVSLSDATQRRQLIRQLAEILRQLGGPASLVRQFDHDPMIDQPESPEQTRAWQQSRLRLQKAAEEVESLSARRFDPQSRSRLRDTVRENFGLVELARLLQWHGEYLQTQRTGAALDSELSLLWWNAYPRVGWIANPLCCHVQPRTLPPALMVMRLDAPQPGMVRDMVLSSIKAESEGLRGIVAVDTRGLRGGNDAYSAFDQLLRNMGGVVSRQTRLELKEDELPGVFPVNSLKNVAVYCGWYSVRNYVPAFSFNTGAIGYHIASFELTSLRGAANHEWCHGLLNDGVVATLGPVAEPYLGAFPRPDEFFPLLFTGKLTLAEVYWKTTPMSSWMICAIGDPLYTPYKMNPALKVSDLPASLRAGCGIDKN